MCKDYPILQTVYDYEIHAFTKITDIYDLDRAPPGILDIKGIPGPGTLNDWYRGCAIPVSRQQYVNHIRQAFPAWRRDALNF